MRCPECNYQDDKVIDSRSTKEGVGVRRRRECLNCGHRFTTYEGIIHTELKVVKRNNIREDFEKEKLRSGITNACYKRPIPSEKLDQLTEDIYLELQHHYEKEVLSADVGNLVMNKLKDLDQVAYVRFASVYRKFKDVDEFIEEIKSLK